MHAQLGSCEHGYGTKAAGESFCCGAVLQLSSACLIFTYGFNLQSHCKQRAAVLLVVLQYRSDGFGPLR